MFLHPNDSNKPPRIWPIFLVLFLAVVGFGGWQVYHWAKSLTPKDIFNNPTVQNLLIKQAGANGQELMDLLPELAGLNGPRTFLLVFANNTELRPAGGFIGSYAVLSVDNGKINLIKLEGVEVLDKKTPIDWKPVPPTPIATYLGVSKWYFRDSNWSPDFALSAQKMLELYTAEGGESADKIDAVIAITPTVIEQLMKQTGPITVAGKEFTADNVTEKLEYEVEYGWEDRDLQFIERKQILMPFFSTLLDRLVSSLFLHADIYFKMANDLIAAKQILAYSPQTELQSKFTKFNLTGTLINPVDDYLLWVDANLGAWKTDHAIRRSLTYQLAPQLTNGVISAYTATATMRFAHTGKFDWRTTRYLDYARIFVPIGAKLIAVQGNTPRFGTKVMTPVDQGEENGKAWFGAFISIEPGETRTLSFIYILPVSVDEKIKAGEYQLNVQKQAGVVGADLTLKLDFSKSKYNWAGALSEDKEFVLNLDK